VNAPLAPARWFVDGVANFPEAARPAIFAVVVVLAFWFLVLRNGFAVLWAAFWRAVAVVGELVISLCLLPEYLQTRRRRLDGLEPKPAALARGDVAERILDWLDGVHERHVRAPVAWRRAPWRTTGVIGLALLVAGILMQTLPAESQAAQQLARAYERWRDVERWAQVPASDRAVEGDALVLATTPALRTVMRDGSALRVTLQCSGSSECTARLVVRSLDGRTVASRDVSLAPLAADTVSFTFHGKSDRYMRRLGVWVVNRARTS
jgi:hypothetical protein